MLIEHSKLAGIPVFELENQTKVADLVDFFIDEDELQAEAAIVHTPGIFDRQKFVSAKEITEISKTAVIVQNEESVVSPKEMVRLNKKIKNRAKIIGEKVYTKKGEYLGTVSDYVLENSTLSIVRIYIKKLFDQRIIHVSAIIKVEQNKITVKDNFEMVKPPAIPVSARTELA
jgi:uncharacterized protein YrrD